MFLQLVFEQIDQCQTIEQLLQLMKSKDEDHDRYYAWNFTNLPKGEIGTIKFRRPPGVIINPRACLPWAEFAVSFVRAAVNLRTEEWLRTKSEDMNGLGFIRRVKQLCET